MGILKRLFSKKKDTATIKADNFVAHRDVNHEYDEVTDNHKYNPGPWTYKVHLSSPNQSDCIVIDVTKEQFEWFAEASEPGRISKGYGIGVL